MQYITGEWLAQQGACGREFDRFLAEWGGEADVTRASLERAKALGLNLLWLGCQIADARTLRAFVGFTLTQRRPALAALLGQGAPIRIGAAKLRRQAAEAWASWAETGSIAARSLAVALREAARDVALEEPTVAEAEEAGRAARRAISYAGMDEQVAADAQIEWLAEKVIAA